MIKMKFEIDETGIFSKITLVGGGMNEK